MCIRGKFKKYTLALMFFRLLQLLCMLVCAHRRCGLAGVVQADHAGCHRRRCCCRRRRQGSTLGAPGVLHSTHVCGVLVGQVEPA